MNELPSQRISRNVSAQFRPDIQGIRAIAVLAVLLYHAGVPVASGGYVGVDVFLVVSGFLITGLLTRELESTGSLALRAFYARRARRLLPASAVTIAAVGGLTFLFLPMSRWASVAGDMFASTFYFMNWRLAASSTDYLASDQAASPLQHFWSLAVEEQFYLLWPILLVLIARWLLRRGQPAAGAVTAAVIVVGVPSLLWSVVLTGASPGQAYFVTTTRLWELALGGGLAILLTKWQPRRESAEALASIGMIAIVASVVLYASDTSFPGWLALVPTVGTAMLIAAGAGRHTPGLSRWISAQPMQAIGNLSYSLYLWHWPIIVVALTYADPLPVWAGLLAVSVSFAPAWLTKQYVEDPVRFADRFRGVGRSGTLALACSMVGVIAAAALALAPTSNTFVVTDQGAGLEPSASDATVISRAQGANGQHPTSAIAKTTTTAADNRVPALITPDPVDAKLDYPSGFPRCQTRGPSSALVRCDYGDPTGEYLVVFTGDSHAMQWMDALDQISRERAWRLVTFVKGSCPHADIAEAGSGGSTSVGCDEWNSALTAELTDRLRPDLVITTSSQYRGLVDGLQRTWQALIDSGISVIPIRDTPFISVNVPECVLASSSTYIDDCSMPTADVIASRTAQVIAAGAMNLPIVDMTDRICTPDFCRPVEFGVLVWRDSNHLTNTYVLEIQADLGTRIDQALATIG